MCNQQWRVYGQYASLLHLFLHWPDNTSRNHPTVFKYPSSSILILVNTPLSLQLEAPLSLMMTSFRRRSKRNQEKFHLQLDWGFSFIFHNGLAHFYIWEIQEEPREVLQHPAPRNIWGQRASDRADRARSILAAIWQVGKGDHTGRAAAAGLDIPRPSRREIRASPMGRPIFVSESVRFSPFGSVRGHENSGHPFASRDVPNGVPTQKSDKKHSLLELGRPELPSSFSASRQSSASMSSSARSH
jgi:hypothetical protein